jgi:hypothetical protein
MVSITPPLLSLQSPRQSSYKKIVTEDRVDQLCIREQKHERPWNIRDEMRERASVGKDDLALALPVARPERRGAAAVPTTHGCSRTGGVRGGPRTPPLAGEVGRRVLSLASEVGLSAAPQEVGEAAATAGDRSATLLRPGSSPRHFSVAVSGRGG